MKKYVLSMRKVNGKEKQYAASQAVDDVTTILNGMGYKTLTRLHSAKRGISSMLDLLLIMKLLFIYLILEINI